MKGLAFHTKTLAFLAPPSKIPLPQQTFTQAKIIMKEALLQSIAHPKIMEGHYKLNISNRTYLYCTPINKAREG
jgi:hypothetical protein